MMEIMDADDVSALLNEAIAALPNREEDMEDIDLTALSQDIEVFEAVLSRMADNRLYADILMHMKRYRVALLMLHSMQCVTQVIKEDTGNDGE